MRNYKKVVIWIVLSLVSLIALIAFGVNQAIKHNKTRSGNSITKDIAKKKIQKATQTQQTEKEFVTQFITSYTNYSNFSDYQKKLKPLITTDIANALNFGKDEQGFGSSSSAELSIYEGRNHQYFGYTVQSLNSGLNIPMAVIIKVDKTIKGYQVSSLYEPSLRGAAVDYIKYWNDSQSIGIDIKNSEDKKAEAFLRSFNNFNSLNNQKTNIKPYLTTEMQEKLAVNNLGSDTLIDCEVNQLYLFKGANNTYVGFVQVNLAGEKSNQVISFKMLKADDTYLVSEFDQPTRQ